MLTNVQLAELLARQAEKESGVLVRAFRRAARRALFWPESAAALVKQNRPLTELTAIGPFIAKRIRPWLEGTVSIRGKIPPVRRDFFALADAKLLLASKPGWPKLLRGDLQMHTCWSDGSGTAREMADAASERGYKYIAITDHSKGLRIAGGIDERALRRQESEIRKTNRAISRAAGRVTMLRSIELNLNPHGDGDMNPRSLARLDLVLGSFHSSLRTTEDQTERYLAALSNPSIQILGHPRGRIYNFRLGLTADWSQVFDCAAELDKAVEIDGYPDRQDLNIDLLRLAKKAGCRISFGTDSHGAAQLRFVEYSAAAALIAGIPRDRILNFMPLDELLQWASSIRERRRRAARNPHAHGRSASPGLRPAAEPEHMTQLDSLRAFAVFLVLAAHTLNMESLPWGLSKVPMGEFGVQLFFVLSGFLITRILLECREVRESRSVGWQLPIRQFYARRFLRISPLYYGVIAVSLVLGVGDASRYWPGLLTYTINVYLAHSGDWIRLVPDLRWPCFPRHNTGGTRYKQLCGEASSGWWFFLYFCFSR